MFIGQTPFDVIAVHDEWIRSGYFDSDVQARLKGPLFYTYLLATLHDVHVHNLLAYSLKSIQYLVKSIENKLRMKQGYHQK